MLEIIVPATSANVGPGFDCLGIALDLYNKFYIEEIDEGVIISGCEEKFRNKNNLVYKSIEYFFNKLCPHKMPKGIKISVKSEIPVSRGLGSSATCIVAGVMAANHLSQSLLNESELIQIATEIEGHPDNITPAILGNMAISILDNNKVYYDKIIIPKELSFCALVPNFRLSTEESRASLPKVISYKDGVFNIGRSSLLISSIVNKNFNLLKIACQDKLHQDYRCNLIDNYYDIVGFCRNSDCLGTFLSGSGPTIMIMVNSNNNNFPNSIRDYLHNFNGKWELKMLSTDINGAILNIL